METAQDMVSAPAAVRPFPCLPFPVDFAFCGIYVFSAMAATAKRYFPVVAGVKVTGRKDKGANHPAG
ncbi:TPA: hypothetical protein ACYE6B_004734 [Klebsiella pneumoniae]|nr:hypothetical protein [Klebsiella pneumoniae]